MPNNINKFESIAKSYRLVNLLFLLFICFVVVIFFMPALSAGPFLFIFPFLFLFLNVALIIATAYLGVRVMDIGWILSFFLSLFGSFITSIIFTCLAANQLKKNGYKVSFIKAVSTVQKPI